MITTLLCLASFLAGYVYGRVRTLPPSFHERVVSHYDRFAKDPLKMTISEISKMHHEGFEWSPGERRWVKKVWARP